MKNHGVVGLAYNTLLVGLLILKALGCYDFSRTFWIKDKLAEIFYLCVIVFSICWYLLFL